MKIQKTVLLTLITAMTSINTQAQTADNIINKWIDAMGGKDKLGSIKTIYTEQELNIMNNMASAKTYLIDGKGFKSESDFGGQKIIDCYGVDSGWSINPLAGINTATDMLSAQANLGQILTNGAGPLFNYTAKGSKAEFTGKEDLNGVSVYKLNLTTSKGVKIIFFIDTTTYYILKQINKLNSNGQDVEMTTVSSNYKKTSDGFVMSFSQELTLPGLNLTITDKKIEVNKEIDPRIFEKPKN